MSWVGQRWADWGQVGQGQVRQGQARRGQGGKSKRGVTSKDSLFQHHHHPNFYDFFPWAIAPFIGNQKKSFKKNIMENNQNVPHKSINSQLLTKSLVYISIASFFFPLDFSGKKACFVLCTVWRVGRDSNAGLLFCILMAKIVELFVLWSWTRNWKDPWTCRNNNAFNSE